MEQVKLGIIGVGNMGSGHVQNILAGKVPGDRPYRRGGPEGGVPPELGQGHRAGLGADL